MADLEEAIRLTQEAVDMTPEDHPDRVTRLGHHGLGLGDRYSRTGLMADLEEAIRIILEAVNATSEDHQDRAVWLGNLGARLGDRFSRTKKVTDLEDAVSYFQAALKSNNSSTTNCILAGKEALRLGAIISNWQKACEDSTVAVNLIPNLISRSLQNSDKQHMLSQVPVGLACDAAAAALQIWI